MTPFYKKIIQVAMNGHIEQLNTLIEQSKKFINYDKNLNLVYKKTTSEPTMLIMTEALSWATVNNHYDCVKLLIPVSDPKSNDSYALRWASEKGYTECVKLLIPVSDPKDNDSQALRCASNNGFTECVKLLIPVSAPKAKNSEALRLAAENNRYECVELLLPYSDISKWGENEWRNINSDTQNIIKFYFSKNSLIESVLHNNNKISKSKKPHKI